MVKYVGKAEKHTLPFAQLVQEAINKCTEPNESGTSVVLRSMFGLIAERDWPAQEAMHATNGDAMVFSSCCFQKVDLRDPAHYEGQVRLRADGLPTQCRSLYSKYLARPIPAFKDMTYLRFLRSVDWTTSPMHIRTRALERILCFYPPYDSEELREDRGRAVLMLHKPHLRFRPVVDHVGHDPDALGNPDEENWSWSDACERWFASGTNRQNRQNREVEHYSTDIPAMDVPDSNDSGELNDLEVEPEEYPLTFAEVVGIRPADQLRQEQVENLGNRDVDLQCDWQPNVLDEDGHGHLEDAVRDKLLYWPRLKQATVPDVADVASQPDGDPGASLNPPQRRVYRHIVSHIESVIGHRAPARIPDPILMQ
ncbi:hypothetical protein E4U52_000556, partial [Claviceps spartinae]